MKKGNKKSEILRGAIRLARAQEQLDNMNNFTLAIAKQIKKLNDNNKNLDFYKK